MEYVGNKIMRETGGIIQLVFIEFKLISVVPVESLITTGKPDIAEVIFKNGRNVIIDSMVLPKVLKDHIVVSERDLVGLRENNDAVLNQDEDQDPSGEADMVERPLHVPESAPVVSVTVNKYVKMNTTNTYRA